MSRILAIDCDLTVCPSDEAWLLRLVAQDQDKGLEPCIKIMNAEDGTIPYNLGELFPHIKDPLEYWRDLNYSQFKPIEGSVEALEKLSQYFKIVFISTHKGTHSKSKYYWLDEHFPFHGGVILTKEKYLMNDSVVALVDDRIDNLEGFDYCKRVQFVTPYTQTSDAKINLKFDKWDGETVKMICKEYLK